MSNPARSACRTAGVPSATKMFGITPPLVPLSIFRGSSGSTDATAHLRHRLPSSLTPESCPKAAVTTDEASRLRRQHPQTGHPLRLYGVEEHIKRRDLSVADDDHIQACIVGRLSARPRSPRQPPGIVEGLGLTVGSVNEVRMGRAEIASKFVEDFGADEYSGRRIQHAVFGIEVLNRCSAARRITLAEDFLKVAVKQFADMVGHRISP